MRVLLIAALAVMLSGCNLVFKLPTRQGNVIEQKQLDQLKLGMTRQQVVYLLGTPIAASPFRPDHWDYTGYYKSPRGKVSSRTVTLRFEKDALISMEGVTPVGGTKPGSDAKTAAEIIKQQKADANQAERDSGVQLSPEAEAVLGPEQPSNKP